MNSLHPYVYIYIYIYTSISRPKMLSPASEGKWMLGEELRDDVGWVVTSITNWVRIHAYHT